MMEKTKPCLKWVTSVLVMLTIWCLWNSVNIRIGSFVSVEDIDNIKAIVNSMASEIKEVHIKAGNAKHDVQDIKTKLIKLEQDIKENLDKLPFGAAWRTMYNEYGEGHIFDWRNSLYTTNVRDNIGVMSWQVQ